MKKNIKIVFLHPPLYPINHKFFLELGKKVDLTVIVFGNNPGLHKNWDVKNFKNDIYKIFLVDTYTDLNKRAVSYKGQMRLDWLKFLVELKPDIVISVAFWIPSFYACLFKRILKYKFGILTDAIYETDKNINNFKKIYRKFLLNCGDFVISSSKLTTKYLKLLAKTQIFESLHAIDVKEWKKRLNFLPDKKDLKIELGLPLNKKILLGVGNLEYKKNWKKVLEAIKNVENIIFILIGEGDLYEELINYIKSNNIYHKVLLIGRKDGDELLKFFKIADIFIFPSLYDQFGFVVLEALASGLPVLCSKNAGASSLIKDKVNGYIIDPIDIKDIENKIKIALQNYDNLKKNIFLEEDILEKKVNGLINFFLKLIN